MLGLSRNAVIAGRVMLFHVAALWALQSGLIRKAAEVVIPVEILSEFIEPPKPRDPPPPPPSSAAGPQAQGNPDAATTASDGHSDTGAHLRTRPRAWSSRNPLRRRSRRRRHQRHPPPPRLRRRRRHRPFSSRLPTRTT